MAGEDLANPGRPVAAEDFAVLAEMSAVKWYEVVTAVLYVLLMAEALRYCAEVPAPLAAKVYAHALLALLFDFALTAAQQVRACAAALRAGGGAAVGRFRLLLTAKLACELGGTALLVLKQAPAAGAALALGGHLLFSSCNTVMVQAGGGTKPVPPPVRRGIATADALLVALCVGGMAPLAPVRLGCAAAFGALVTVYMVWKVILKKPM